MNIKNYYEVTIFMSRTKNFITKNLRKHVLKTIYNTKYDKKQQTVNN